MENSKSTLPSLRELHGSRLAGYSMGFFGLMLMLMLTESYSYNFYVYTIRLDSILVSIGSTINMLSMGFSSIIFGVILDNTKPNKIGKRRPYILLGLPLWLIAAILIYFPPWIPPVTPPLYNTVLYWPTAIWYWVMNMIKAIFGSLLMIVFSSVLPEISQTLANRKKAAMVATNLRILSSIISISFPNILQSLLEDPTNTGYWTNDGKFIMKIMPIISIIFGIIAMILILISFFSIDESFHLTGRKFEKRTIKATFKNIFKPTKDKEYMKFMVAGVNTQSSQFVLIFTIIPFIGFVLGRNLPSKQFLFILYIIISISTRFVWLYIWRLIIKRKGNLLKIYKLNVIIIAVAAFFELFFLFELNLFLRIILFILSFGTVLGSMYSTNLFHSPLMNELIDRAAENHVMNDENEFTDKNQAVTRISGSYYGLFSLSVSILAAISSTIFGFIFQGNNSRNPVILTLGLMSMGLFHIVAFAFLKLLKVKFKES
ncbi:MAG: MFS transporter [Thermodesulfobacteriota bacterium]